VTVTATVFAMQYAVLEDDTTFSPGGIAGIVIGCALGLGGLLGAFLGLRRVRQRKQSLARIESELRGGEGAVPGSSVVPISSQYTPFRPRSPPSPGGKTEEVKLPHGEMTPKAAVRAAELLASRLRLEPIKEVPSDPSSRVATLARRYQDPPDHPKATHTFAYPGSTIRATPVRFYDKPVPAPSPNPPAWQEMYMYGSKAPPGGVPPVNVYSGKPKLPLQIPPDVQPTRPYPEASTTTYPPPLPLPPPARKFELKPQPQQRTNPRDGGAQQPPRRFPMSSPQDQGQTTATTTPRRFPIAPQRNYGQASSSGVNNAPEWYYATVDPGLPSEHSQTSRQGAVMDRPRDKHPGRDLTRGGRGL
jgi:hypothetical protein